MRANHISSHPTSGRRYLHLTKTFYPAPSGHLVHLHSLLEWVILLSINSLCFAESFCLTLEFFLMRWQSPGPHCQAKASLGALCQHHLWISEAGFELGVPTSGAVLLPTEQSCPLQSTWWFPASWDTFCYDTERFVLPHDNIKNLIVPFLEAESKIFNQIWYNL